MKTRIISLVNQKGGVGKTTTTFNLGHGLAREGKRVLLVDLDAQSNLSVWAGLSDPRRSMAEVLNKSKTPISEIIVKAGDDKPDIAPTTGLLTGMDDELSKAPDAFTRLSASLESISGQYDFILIDCPPSLGMLTMNALIASDEVFIPTQAKVLGLSGIIPLMEAIDLVHDNFNPKLKITGVITCMFDTRTNLSKEVVAQLRDFPALRDSVFDSLIRENVKLAEAFSFEQSIFEYAPSSYGAEDYRNLAQEIIKRN